MGLMGKITVAILALALMCAAAAAEDASDEAVIEFRGLVQGGAKVLSRADVEKLPMQLVTTKTPWHTSVVAFEGVLMRDLLAAVQAKGSKIRVVALNKYATEIPIKDFTDYGAILAYKRDGKYMPVRDKGPFFIVYPYDSDVALQSEKFYVRSAWQVATITVE